ncbi:MAG TPA: hypothetical protein VLB49_01565 [Gemmatimonadales bacterium]|nr:hypothetical protein [Gemmatimonadales bacterium]
MLDLIRNRLRQGIRTLAFPKSPPPELPERFRGRPTRDALMSPRDSAGLDLGTCLFSPEEVATYTRDYRMAVARREDLVTPTGEVQLARALDERSRRLFGRSLRLRSVVAGSCGGCEAELVALGNVVFDLGRFGVQFVASPRHADGLVVTGAVNVNMQTALRKTYDAVPAPKIVLAVGACALSGGPFRGSPEVGNGVEGVPVDLWVPGCPPHPLTILDGILRLLGAIEDGTR